MLTLDSLLWCTIHTRTELRSNNNIAHSCKYHIIFYPKYRRKVLTADIAERLKSIVYEVAEESKCEIIEMEVMLDHVHILCMLSKKVALMDLLEKVKANSSKWIKTKGEDYKHFYWQDGYGAFSVNHTEVDVVVKYIANQHEHHRKKTFQEEYRAFLKKYEVEYDERYVWD